MLAALLISVVWTSPGFNWDPTPRQLVERSSRSLDARRPRELHGTRMMVRGQGSRRARRFVRGHRDAIRRCVFQSLERQHPKPYRMPAALVLERNFSYPDLLLEVSFDGPEPTIHGREDELDDEGRACIAAVLSDAPRADGFEVLVMFDGRRCYAPCWSNAVLVGSAVSLGFARLKQAAYLDKDTRPWIEYRARSLRREALAYFEAAYEMEERPEYEVLIGIALEAQGRTHLARRRYASYRAARPDAPDDIGLTPE